MNFSKGEHWKTRDGRCARVDADDYGGSYPLVGRIYETEQKNWATNATSWSREGHCSFAPSPNDLVSSWGLELFPWCDPPRLYAYLQKTAPKMWQLRWFECEILEDQGCRRAPWLDEPLDPMKKETL